MSNPAPASAMASAVAYATISADIAEDYVEELEALEDGIALYESPDHVMPQVVFTVDCGEGESYTFSPYGRFMTVESCKLDESGTLYLEDFSMEYVDGKLTIYQDGQDFSAPVLPEAVEEMFSDLREKLAEWIRRYKYAECYFHRAAKLHGPIV